MIRKAFLPCPSCHDFSLIFSRFRNLDTLDTLEITKLRDVGGLPAVLPRRLGKSPAGLIGSISTLVPNHRQAVQSCNTLFHIRFAHPRTCVLRWITYRSITTVIHPFLSIIELPLVQDSPHRSWSRGFLIRIPTGPVMKIQKNRPRGTLVMSPSAVGACSIGNIRKKQHHTDTPNETVVCHTTDKTLPHTFQRKRAKPCVTNS